MNKDIPNINSKVQTVNSNDGLKKIGFLIVISIIVAFVIFILQFLVIGSFIYTIFFGIWKFIIILEVGVLIIFGFFAYYYDPLFEKDNKSPQIGNNINLTVALSQKKKQSKTLVSGLKSNSSNTTPNSFNRADRIYWGKIMIISGILLLGIDTILEYLIIFIF